MAVLSLPQSSHAGFFSLIARFFASAPQEIEEGLPALVPQTKTAAAASALESENRPPADSGEAEADVSTSVIQENAIIAPLNPAGTLSSDAPLSGQIFIYTIRPGDTPTGIAKSFGVSVNTILWANNLPNTRSLKAGDQIVILPITGVKHEVKKGETISSIAKKYRGSIDDIIKFNGLSADADLAVGMSLIVPNGELREVAPASAGISSGSSFASLPVYEGYYIRPTSGGRRSRGIHGYNGVDLANSCGLPIFASAEGQVILARTSGWNGGYGRYIVISHANSTQTLYAHMKELNVVNGQIVRQGEVIGTVGSSGNSTGCHVHFEIRGAKNPF